MKLHPCDFKIATHERCNKTMLETHTLIDQTCDECESNDMVQIEYCIFCSDCGFHYFTIIADHPTHTADHATHASDHNTEKGTQS